MELKELDPSLIQTLQNSIIPKFLDLLNNPIKKQIQASFFSNLLPKKSLNTSTEEYVKQKNLSNFEIIINSIEFTKQKLSDEEIQDLATILLPLSDNLTLRIVTYTGKAIYLEVLNIINYAFKAQDLINNYPKRNANHLGTKHRTSSESNLVKVHRSHLVERLESPFFAIDDQQLIEMTNLQIKYIDLFMSKEDKNLPDVMNWIESTLGLDNKIANYSQIELKAIRQVLSLFNGIRTSPKELVRSVMINTLNQSNLDLSDKDKNKIYAESIYQFSKYLFYDIFVEDAKMKRSYLTYTPKTLVRDSYSKTVINDLPIFAYMSGKQEDFILKYFTIGIESIFGIESIQEEQSNISGFGMLRNFYNALIEFGFSKKDIRVLLSLCQIMDEQSLPLISTSDT